MLNQVISPNGSRVDGLGTEVTDMAQVFTCMSWMSETTDTIEQPKDQMWAKKWEEDEKCRTNELKWVNVGFHDNRRNYFLLKNIECFEWTPNALTLFDRLVRQSAHKWSLNATDLCLRPTMSTTESSTDYSSGESDHNLIGFRPGLVVTAVMAFVTCNSWVDHNWHLCTNLVWIVSRPLRLPLVIRWFA